MKKFLVLFCSFIIAGGIFYSCNKEVEPLIDEQEITPISSVEQYIDHKLVANDFLDKPEDYRAVQVNRLDENGNLVIESHFFSTEKLYAEFGKTINVDLEGMLKFEKGIHEYLEKHPSLEEIEDANNLPEHYVQFEKELYANVFGNQQASNRGTSLIFKECNKANTAFVTLSLPAMWPGWNNETSMNFGVYVGAAWNIFDRTFYRRHLTTYVWFGGYDCWQGRFYDNAMSSVVLL